MQALRDYSRGEVKGLNKTQWIPALRDLFSWLRVSKVQAFPH
jgi:hypothetical protein